MFLSTSSLIFPYFKGDPIVLYNELYPQIQGHKESLREIEFKGNKDSLREIIKIQRRVCLLQALGFASCLQFMFPVVLGNRFGGAEGVDIF